MLLLRHACVALCALGLGLGCAEGASLESTYTVTPGSGGAGGASTGAGGSGGDTSGAGASGGGGDLTAQSCPPGQLATGFEDGKLVCSSLDETVRDAVNGGCSVYLGWRDECSGCTNAPAKWGYAGASVCMNGAGADDTCTEPLLGGQNTKLFGLNTDGDVNGDDKLYLGLRCDEGSSATAPAPCGPGELVSGLNEKDATCAPASGAILEYVRKSCSLYFGWRDDCNACTNAPAKWGRASPTDCSTGVGAGNTCTTPTLGGHTVQLFGLSTGGDVDGNDKLYVGVRCEPAEPATSTAMGACPPGQFVAGIEADGTLACATPAPLAAGYFKDHCALYFGFRDECSGCTNAPAKWGRARESSCTNDLGADGTCQTVVLDGASVELFGLSTDGDVNDDDKLYVGFRCD
jgi:hypothetical protein